MPEVEANTDNVSQVPEARINDIADCDGLAIDTPIYCGGLSSAMKHLFDNAAKI